jgi:sterol desaturase/sphingolipid hydroxylase (fatty acid hydroxylase superfamily)
MSPVATPPLRAAWSLEQSPAAQRCDAVVYATLVAVLAGFALLRDARPAGWALAGWVLAGALAWSLVEYGLHRFVLHGVQPFRAWHAAHHRRPGALIGLPTAASALLFGAFAFAPVWWAAGFEPACDFMLGLLGGYLVYGLVHQGLHRAAAGGGWLRRQRRWHARHHGSGGSQVAFGVTSALWDHVFGSALRQRSQRRLRRVGR